MRHPFFDLPTPIVIGHGGSSGEAPENTLPAFARALEQGAAILETDVHATHDGVVVVYHPTRRCAQAAGPVALPEGEPRPRAAGSSLSWRAAWRRPRQEDRAGRRHRAGR